MALPFVGAEINPLPNLLLLIDFGEVGEAGLKVKALVNTESVSG